MWETIVIYTVIGILKVLVKDSIKAAELRSILLLVRNSINDLYYPLQIIDTKGYNECLKGGKL